MRGEVLDVLHSAHQGVTGMLERAQSSVWWPGITPQIQERRNKCKNCNEHAPSQPRAPPTPLENPEYPFQQIVADYFQEKGSNYLVIADRFSGWPTLLFCGNSTASRTVLIDTLRSYFSTYGIPEELATDGGSTFTAYETKKFLSDYGVRHRLSSVAFPHSNQRAELAVKSMKRLLRENVGIDGKLNTDSFQRAVMQYRNTPDRDTGRSPSQVIFGRELRDFIPAPMIRYKQHPRWLLLQEDREKALRKRALRNIENLNIHSRTLPKLNVHDIVQIQNQVGCKATRWDATGIIVEVKSYDQYLVKVHGSGRLTLRNRKFLKKIQPYGVSEGPVVDMPYLSNDRTICSQPNSHEAPTQHQKELSDNKLGDEDLIQAPLCVENQVENQDITERDPEQQSSMVPELRRSTRLKEEPKRLNIKSWTSQSYEANNLRGHDTK